jgi:hypothetical protein
MLGRPGGAADNPNVALGIVRSGSVLITKAIAGDGPVSAHCETLPGALEVRVLS